MLTVVKLGGSLYHSPFLQDWLQHLTTLSENQLLLIVPGGGPFADTVRKAQQDHSFTDKTAHQMAINAMRQFALLIHDFCPAAQRLTDLKQQLPATGLFIWLPDDTAMLSADLPQSWQVTSDSLALWLAQQLDAQQLILLKSSTISDDKISALTASGVLDQHFHKQYQQRPLPCSIVEQANVTAGFSSQIDLQ